ncbi:MAG: glucose-6-phosphate dehydrogenase [Alphaproteobacteria bacterium]|nr:MAG: glucose-6-phosphate dehydrogenase [Alphaproteobacteria bacterium]
MKALDIVIFGGSGDLSLRKLMPALYFLYSQGKLAKGSRVVGLSRARISRDDFRALILEKLALYLGDDYVKTVAQAFCELLDYRDLDISDDQSWGALKDYLGPVGRCGIIYYMAVPPTLFGTVCEQLDRQGLAPDSSRLVVEKPLGEDAQSAEAVNKILSASFREEQIYRIDHYLGKEAVQNILAFRFEDGRVESLWNREHIDNIQITVAETVGVEGRAAFLDRAGILRDMIQNHLMQILCFIAMDAPEKLTANDVRDRKVAVVRALRPVTALTLADHVVRAQYGPGEAMGRPVPGYMQEIRGQEIRDKDIAGTGETFIAVRVCVDNDRWRGVPFYLRTGKRLSGRFARIIVNFRNAEINRVILNIQPDMTIHIDDVLLQDSAHSGRIPDAYEKLLGDVMQGNQSYFVRHDEIIASWEWIDGIRKAWADLEMHSYPAGSMGPDASDGLLAASGHKWYED